MATVLRVAYRNPIARIRSFVSAQTRQDEAIHVWLLFLCRAGLGQNARQQTNMIQSPSYKLWSYFRFYAFRSSYVENQFSSSKNDSQTRASIRIYVKSKLWFDASSPLKNFPSSIGSPEFWMFWKTRKQVTYFRLPHCWLQPQIHIRIIIINAASVLALLCVISAI